MEGDVLMEALITQDGTIFNWRNVLYVYERGKDVKARIAADQDGYCLLATYDNADTRKSVLNLLALAVNAGRKTFVFPQ